MRTFSRMLVLFLLVVGLAVPAVGEGIGRGAADAAGRPCASQPSWNACVLEDGTSALAPRGAAPADIPCHAKAFHAEVPEIGRSSACERMMFESSFPRWASWIPPSLDRPPRS